MQGEALFASVGCTKCHIPTWTTSNSPTLETALRGKTIHPYSDFLLHDMGLLADGVVQGDANEHELRTPTLWNLRTRDPMLHNSAAAGDTFENRVVVAIQAHGPFGEGAASAAAFANLSASDQAALVRFLGSLGRLEFDDDGSGGIDVVDLIGFEFCLNAAVTPEDPCAVHDVNQDGVVDLADFDVFLTVYEGVQGDCNFNGQNDLIDILLGLAEDADFDGIPDACALPGRRQRRLRGGWSRHRRRPGQLGRHRRSGGLQPGRHRRRRGPWYRDRELGIVHLSPGQPE